MQTYRDFVYDVLGPIAMLPVLEVPITDALGCCAAEDVSARSDVPGYRQAVVEGVAVAAGDARNATSATPVILPVSESVAAGAPAPPLPPGHCARVAAGARVPQNAVAVISSMDCYLEEHKVVLNRAPVPGEGLREVGGLFAEGDPVVARGEYLGHVAIAQLAQTGHPRVKVHPRPRVVVVTIGSELVRVSETAGDGQLHDATGVLLMTTAMRLGADCHRVGPVPDDPRAVRDAIEDQLVRADMVVTAGGIDTKDDVLRRELLKASIARFDGPALAPCGPYGVGRIGPDETPIVTLPGDPAAALLAFHALARPVIAAMLGRDVHSSDETILPPRTARSGSRVVPGTFTDGRFRAVGAEPPTLRELAGVTAIAIHHAGNDVAEVVEWPF